jgi:TolA-binding protein
MKYKLLLLFLFTNIVFSKEVSVFGAGDLNSKKPYGLTSAEKVTFANKVRLDKLNKKINSLSYKLTNVKSRYDDLDQKLEGMSSVFENDGENINKTKRLISNINNDIDSANLELDKIKKLSMTNSNNIIELEKRLDSFINLQNLNNKKVLNLLNKINKNYISKKQFDELVNFINSKKTKKQKNKKTKKQKLTNKQKLSKAIRMVNKHHYAKSIPLWNELLKSNYMPATVNYYMGEVRFAKQEYQQAIGYYKTSMMLYDEAKYIPNLLLHSAISFEKIKDNENALNFYYTLVDVYSSSKEAKIAKKHLKKLE